MSGQLPSSMHETLVRRVGDLRPTLRGSRSRSTSALLGSDLGFVGILVNRGGREPSMGSIIRPHPREWEDLGCRRCWRWDQRVQVVGVDVSVPSTACDVVEHRRGGRAELGLRAASDFAVVVNEGR